MNAAPRIFAVTRESGGASPRRADQQRPRRRLDRTSTPRWRGQKVPRDQHSPTGGAHLGGCTGDRESGAAVSPLSQQRPAIRRASPLRGGGRLRGEFRLRSPGAAPTITHPDGTTTTLAYSGWTITRTDRNGHSRTAVKDAYRRTIQIQEPTGGVTHYGYDTMGRLTTVTDAAGNVTSITYDALGRKIQLTDPDMGTWSYGYNAASNLLTQTDAKGQTVQFTYDALNRVATKSYPGAVLLPLARGSKTTIDNYTNVYQGGICVANSSGQCTGGDLRTAPTGTLIGYLQQRAGPGRCPPTRPPVTATPPAHASAGGSPSTRPRPSSGTSPARPRVAGARHSRRAGASPTRARGSPARQQPAETCLGAPAHR